MADRSDSDREENDKLIQRAVASALKPVQVLTSRPAVKAYLSTLLFLSTSLILFTVSTTAYAFFYYSYIPQINLERIIHLQYGLGPHPYASAALDTNALISQQPYDIELLLHMPRTPKNLEAGNFMLDLSLISPESSTSASIPDPIAAVMPNISIAGAILHRSRRPTILPYASPVLSLSHTLLNLPWHLLSFRDLDSSQLVVPMFELLSFSRGTRNVPTHLRLEVQSESVLQIYSAKVAFRARFQGMRYLIYNNRIITFLSFTAIFYVVSIVSMVVAWTMITRALSADKDVKKETVDQQQIKQEAESNGFIKTDSESKRGTMPVKTEDDEEESSTTQGLSLANISDTATQFPTGRGQMPLRFPGRDTSRDQEAVPDQNLVRQSRPDDVADDEEEDEQDEQELIRGRRFDIDSGIGTSMESENVPGASNVTRRRSRQSFDTR